MRPARPNGHGQAWERLVPLRDQINDWIAGKSGSPALNLVKVHELLTRQGGVIPCRTLHRFATEHCGYRVKGSTVRVKTESRGSRSGSCECSGHQPKQQRP